MEAGRELDALVAEKVMGLTVWRDTHGDMLINLWSGPPGDLDAFVIPRYSTDMAFAWQVVEALRTRTPQGFEVEFHLKPPREGRKPVYEAMVIFQQDFYRYRRFAGVSDTGSVPHAICLAALQAVGAL